MSLWIVPSPTNQGQTSTSHFPMIACAFTWPDIVNVFLTKLIAHTKRYQTAKRKTKGHGGRWYVKRGEFGSSLAMFWRSSIWGTHFFCKYLNIITVSCTWPTWRGKNKLKSDSWCWKRHSLSFWHASFHFYFLSYLLQLCALCTRCHLWGGMGSESLIWICLFKYFFFKHSNAANLLYPLPTMI